MRSVPDLKTSNKDHTVYGFLNYGLVRIAKLTLSKLTNY